jgi:hypothetical protein
VRRPYLASISAYNVLFECVVVSNVKQQDEIMISELIHLMSFSRVALFFSLPYLDKQVLYFIASANS